MNLALLPSMLGGSLERDSSPSNSKPTTGEALMPIATSPPDSSKFSTPFVPGFAIKFSDALGLVPSAVTDISFVRS